MFALSTSAVKINNFGDNLNQAISRDVFGSIVRPDQNLAIDEPHGDVKIYAIGSFLSQELLNGLGVSRRAIICGLGAGYAQFPIVRTFGLGRQFPAAVGNKLSLPIRQNTPLKTTGYSIYWVRGPLTARLMGLPESVAVGDAGYMIRQSSFFKRYENKNRDGVAFMPHFTAANNTLDLNKTCSDLGIQYIDPGMDQFDVLNAISTTKMLITEALHGAIIADALRVPWIAVKSSEDIFDFKWRDWCCSIGKDYSPYPIRVRWDVHNFTGRRPRNVMRYFTNRLRSKYSQITVRNVDTAKDLVYAMGQRPSLSTDLTMKRIDQGIRLSIRRFFTEYETGNVFV